MAYFIHNQQLYIIMCVGVFELGLSMHKHRIEPCSYKNWCGQREPESTTDGILQGIAGGTCY